MALRHQLERANHQRLASLKNALNTVRCFAEPSLDPEQFKNFEEINKVLLKRYAIKK